MADLTRGTIFRIISLSLAGGDVVQTIPQTVRFYRAQWAKGRRVTTVCFFYAMARYMSILSLIANAHAAFSPSPNFEACKRIYLLPNVTALLAAIAVQVLVYLRTVAISGRSKYVRVGLGSIMLLGFPVQTFGIVYHRDPFFASNGLCKGEVLRAGEPDWNIVFYSANMAFDFIACVTATYYIVASSQFHQLSRLSKFFRHILRDGLLYFVVVFLVNLWVVLEFAHVFASGAASMLPLAVVLIAVQHLILSTHHITSVNPNNNKEDFSSSVSQGPPRFYTSTNDVELQSGVFARDKNVSLNSKGQEHRISTSDAGPAI
ncbi:hypothetical protein C8F04DRAFT_1088736 [Mycena alexandri]|uniref:Uncharacterized protein n=1 Tax=Mycena alexandri TaxID=1745969 RepID=A0AAD6X6M9_9AGAR|nr:hypothetical protein C8F04DRAFT_1088736 [Mycena alexandri]